jgi:ABC-type ATPase with predicted acetyltransferase domain
LKRRPNHGPDFLRKMNEMNRDGALAITIYHSLQKEVLALTQFAWRCRQCGRVYRRQRRTIQPRRHHCGICRGLLQELVGSVSRVPTDSERASHERQCLPLNAPYSRFNCPLPSSRMLKKSAREKTVKRRS